MNRADQVLAEYQEGKNLLSLKKTLIDTITEVIYAYRSFLLARRGVDINRLSFDRSKELLNKIRILIEEGRRAKMEITQAETDVAKQELNFLISQNVLDTNRLNLLKLLDIDQHTLIEPTESIEVEPVQLDTAILLQLVFKNHIQYQQSLLANKEAQLNILLAKNDRLWQLDLEAGYNITDSGTYDIETLEESNVGAGDYFVEMNLTIPFGDDTAQRELLNTEIEYRKSKIALQELKENIAIDVQGTHRNILMKWKQVELSRKVRELSQKQLDISPIG
ncbi:hypothetical protein KKHLCK_10035 [Candidatus Electrothrix laxa]